MFQNRLGDFLGTLWDTARYHPYADRFRFNRLRIGFWRRFRRKKRETLRRINLGCGPDVLPGWCNVDVDGKPDLRFNFLNRFPIPDETAELVYCEHTLEHFHIEHLDHILSETRRILRPGGVLRISVPRVEASVGTNMDTGSWPVAKMDGPSMVALNAKIFGHQHRVVYTMPLLEHLLRAAGFSEVRSAKEGAGVWFPTATVVEIEGRREGNLVVEARKSV